MLRLFFVRLARLTLLEVEGHADPAPLCRQGTVNLLLNMLEKSDDEEQLEHRQRHVVVGVVDTALIGRQPRHLSTLFEGSFAGKWLVCCVTIDYFDECDQLLLRQAGRVSVFLLPESSSASTQTSGGSTMSTVTSANYTLCSSMPFRTPLSLTFAIPLK